MKILLTGSTGYIGRRLLPVLLADGHQIVCLVRDARRFDYEDFTPEQLQHIIVITCDLTDPAGLPVLPEDLDVAFYLVHSMSTSYPDFSNLERQSADNFMSMVRLTRTQQVIYLSGIANASDLSDHLQSRRQVEDVLKTSHIPVTILRAAIIIGSGSASFEIIRDLVEKLPVMVAPRWLSTRCQPIAIRNVIEYLNGVMLQRETYGETFDIGGPDILTYHDMLMGYARVRGLKRLVIPVPLLSPKLSSLWLYFVTATSYALARSLVSSLKNEVVCQDMCIQTIVPARLLTYEEALQAAFDKIQQHDVVSSWKDTIGATIPKNFLDQVTVPDYGCLKDVRTVTFNRATEEVLDNIWQLGGEQGWYFGNWLWRIRGLLDKMVGGVGLRRGRRSPTDLKAGDALDFWRVLLADRTNGRLLLFAEMKLPGEAWLEFRIKDCGTHQTLIQTATFRPLGLWGRLYWYALVPVHGVIFPQLAKNIVGRAVLK